MHIFPFPFVDKESSLPHSGRIYSLPEFCKKANHKKCKNYYKKIHGQEGFHTCPYGFSSVVKKIDGIYIIFSGILIENNFHKKKIKQKINNNFVPKFSEKEIISFLEYFIEFAKNKKECSVLNYKIKESYELINSLFHEIRKLNNQVKRQSEEANKELSNIVDANEILEKVKYKIDNIFATSSLISVRLNSYDIDVNPSLITSEPKRKIQVYKKFEKVSHCLHSMALEKKIKITFVGNSFFTMDGYQVFELLPFLLFENAIKFSPKEQEITVTFEEESDELKIIISSFGPTLKENEVLKIFEKKYRGENAQKVKTGTGTGLYFAKVICDLHNINIEAKPQFENRIKIDNIDYSIFNVILTFSRNFD